LDSPAGVGFSYSKNLSDYTTAGDVKTASDTHTFLLKVRKLLEFSTKYFHLNSFTRF